jgi:uncharacterized protein YndB with AHSA1/START domain
VIEVTEQINAVRREVGTRVVEAGELRTATLTRTYAAAVADVWDACTNPERIARWFLPVSGDLRAGGHYSLEGNASGTIERCDPPLGFTATWEFGGHVSWIEVRLRPVDDEHTHFELEHIGLVDDEMWAKFGPGAVGVGWDLTVLGLGLHLESGEFADRAEAMAWTTSPDGRRFITLSSDSWRQAHVAAGADPDAASAGAKRTTEFYAP